MLVIQAVHLNKERLSAFIVGRANKEIRHLVLLEPRVGLVQVYGKLAVTLIAGKDDLLDAPGLQLHGLAPAPLERVRLHHVVDEDDDVRATDIIPIDRDGVVAGVLRVVDFEVQALARFQWGQEVPGLDIVVSVAVLQRLREDVAVLVRGLLNGNVGALLIIEDVAEPKACLTYFVVSQEDIAPV